jgi:membrane-bound lytic murein transglycosylase A
METRLMIRAAFACGLAASLAACASTAPAPAPIKRPGAVQPSAPTPAAEFQLQPARFADIPGWAAADFAPALTAFKRQCDAWRNRTPDAALSGGRYGGAVGAWLPACDVAATVLPGQEHWFFETYFTPQLVVGAGDVRLTSYFEPIIEASRTPQYPFTEPLLRRPTDMLTVDLGAFAEAYNNDALRGAQRTLTAKLVGDNIEPYPKREAIQPAPGQAFAYAHPADVYNLQVQGSGRIHFQDGVQERAQYAAQNGYKWNSALGALKNSGQLATATWAGFRQWHDANPGATRGALNADPSYVFFDEQAIADPAAGPRGGAGVPLTAMGSLAVDPAYHPYGAVIFVDGVYEGYAFDRLLVAQDTGGAIRKGPMRGDVFAGSGPEAGAWAEKMNGPARWWTLLPRAVTNAPIASLAQPSRG